MSNQFSGLRHLIDSFGASEIPAERLFYLNSIKKLIAIGKKLNQLKPDAETQKRIQRLEAEIKNYKLYPKLKSVSE